MWFAFKCFSISLMQMEFTLTKHDLAATGKDNVRLMFLLIVLLSIIIFFPSFFLICFVSCWTVPILAGLVLQHFGALCKWLCPVHFIHLTVVQGCLNFFHQGLHIRNIRSGGTFLLLLQRSGNNFIHSFWYILQGFIVVAVTTHLFRLWGVMLANNRNSGYPDWLI